MQKADINPWEPQQNENGHSPHFFAQRLSRTKSFLDIDLQRILRIWPWVLVFALLGLTAGYTILRYSTSLYKASSTINIQQKEEISLGQALFGTRDPFNDKLGWFRSPSVAKEVVDKMRLRFSAISEGVIKNKDLYTAVRWYIISNNDPAGKIKNISFKIIPSKNGFQYEYGKIKGTAKWDEPFSLGTIPIIINKYADVSPGKEIICTARDPWQVAFAINHNLQINSYKESNIIDISYIDISPERAVDILNTLVEVYNESLVSEKEESFSKAIDFIDKRIGPLNKELDSIEGYVSSFKSQKGFVGSTSNGVLYQQQLFSTDQQLVGIRLQKQTIQALENYINDPETKDENLSLVGITDSYLQNQLLLFQKLRGDRIALSKIVTENNEDLKQLDAQIVEVKKNLILQVGNYKRNIQLSENEYGGLLNRSKSLIQNTPPDEKILLDQARQQNIKEQLFLLLLQKREEAAVAKASVTVNTKILKPALAQSNPVSPDKNKTLLSFLIAGALLPLLFILSKELMNRKIISKKQLDKIISIPVLAELEYDKESPKKSVIMDYGDRTIFSEQIRLLRANLNFYSRSNKGLFILVTSSMSGEGKTFVSSNLARSYSMLGKRVALIEMDLRRPKLSKRFNVNNKKGISLVLNGELKPEEIVVSLLDNEVLHLFPSGTIPPNPSELLSSEYANIFKEYLAANYDVIIIDTPPYGIVADAQLLAHWANATLIITRFNMTIVDQANEIQHWHDQKIFPHMAVVFNAIQMKGYYGYQYGYYYYRKRKGYNYYVPSTEAL